VLMHDAVAQHTFTAHRRAHDAGMGAAVQRAMPYNRVKAGQHQPHHAGDETVAAFVAECRTREAAKLLQHTTARFSNQISVSDRPAQQYGSMVNQHGLAALAQPVQCQRAKATAGEDGAMSCSDAALACAPVASTAAQGELDGGVAATQAQREAAPVQHELSASASTDQSCGDSEVASAMRSALALCGGSVEGEPAWTNDTAGERVEEAASDEPEMAAEPDELVFEPVSVDGQACSERAAAACGEREGAACDAPEMATEPDELVFEPVSVDGQACSEPGEAAEPDELV
jgi:hypothetical protein